jgi:hypothetical protein
MKKLFLGLAVLLFAICLFSQHSLADCPNVPAPCDYGAIGWRGTCWNFPDICKNCGHKYCPDLPDSYKDMPQHVNSSCLKKILSGRVDGCSVPKEINPMYRHVFKAACDEHDICYHTDTSKSHCDNDFRNNMLYICDHYYKGITNVAQEKACEAAAALFYSGVVVGGQSGYDGDQDWKKNCPNK